MVRVMFRVMVMVRGMFRVMFRVKVKNDTKKHPKNTRKTPKRGEMSDCGSWYCESCYSREELADIVTRRMGGFNKDHTKWIDGDCHDYSIACKVLLDAVEYIKAVSSTETVVIVARTALQSPEVKKIQNKLKTTKK